MPRLRQIELTDESLDIPVDIIEQKVVAAVPELTKQEEVVEILNNNGASLPILIKRLSHLNQSSEDDRVIHDTGKTLLGLHGVMEKKERESQTNIQIIVQTDPAKMSEILNPQRM